MSSPKLVSSDYFSVELIFEQVSQMASRFRQSVSSPNFCAFGSHFNLYLYPYGDVKEFSVSVEIVKRLNRRPIRLEATIIFKDTDGYHMRGRVSPPCTFNSLEYGPVLRVGDILERSSMLSSVAHNDTLVIEVRLRLLQYTPKNNCNSLLLNLLEDGETDSLDPRERVGASDMIFEVGDERRVFYAHRLILRSAPPLANLYDENKESITVRDVDPDVFRLLLHCCYGGEATREDLLATCPKKCIDAADKYGVVYLKLKAEEVYVDSIKPHEWTAEDVIDDLIYADSKHLELLREACLEYIVEKKANFLAMDFSFVPGRIITDLLSAVARTEDDEEDSEDEGFNKKKLLRMRIQELRLLLWEKNLEVDCSRQAAVTLLQTSSVDSSNSACQV